MKASADSDPALGQRDGGAAVDPAQGSAPNADATAPLAATSAGSAACSGTTAVGTTVRLEPGVEGEKAAPPKQQPPARTSRLSPGSENEARVVMPCNCGENGSSGVPGCVHIQIYRIRVDTINAGLGDADTQRHQNKTFLMWLMDEDHLEDHAMFLISVVFCVSLIMMLTFAWLEADLALAGAWWLWAGLLALLLMVQSCTWVSFALYSLWLYPKAYFRWKAESQGPLHRPRSASRHRQRRRPRRRRSGSSDTHRSNCSTAQTRHRRSRSSGSRRSSNSTATQTQSVYDADQRA